MVLATPKEAVGHVERPAPKTYARGLLVVAATAYRPVAVLPTEPVPGLGRMDIPVLELKDGVAVADRPADAPSAAPHTVVVVPVRQAVDVTAGRPAAPHGRPLRAVRPQARPVGKVAGPRRGRPARRRPRRPTPVPQTALNTSLRGDGVRVGRREERPQRPVRPGVTGALRTATTTPRLRPVGPVACPFTPASRPTRDVLGTARTTRPRVARP